MVEVRVRDAFVISTVIGLMVTVMGSMMAFFATGMDEDGIISSLRTGFVLGLGVGTVVLMFALARVRNHAEKGQAREEARAAAVRVAGGGQGGAGSAGRRASMTSGCARAGRGGGRRR